MGCRWMLGIEDRAAIMAEVNADLSQVCVAHLIGRTPVFGGVPCGPVRKLLTVCLCGFCPGRLV